MLSIVASCGMEAHNSKEHIWGVVPRRYLAVVFHEEFGSIIVGSFTFHQQAQGEW